MAERRRSLGRKTKTRWVPVGGYGNSSRGDDVLPALATDSESETDTFYGSDEEAEWDIDADFDFGLDPERPPIPDPPFSWPSPFCSLPSDPLNTTPIDIHRWEELTESFPNQEAVEHVSRGLREGFSLQFYPIPPTSVRICLLATYPQKSSMTI